MLVRACFPDLKVTKVLKDDRVYTPHLPAKIPSLRDLVEGSVDSSLPIPSQLPTETAKSEAVNSHQLRYSDTPQHENLHTNIDPVIMSYTQHPIPNTISEDLREKYGSETIFRDRDVIRKWVENIFVRDGNDKLVELNTTVERAEKKGGKWVLKLRRDGPDKNYWWQEQFDALIVASGHYNIPWIPNIPGLLEYDARFPGRVLHSKHYRDATKYRGKVCDVKLQSLLIPGMKKNCLQSSTERDCRRRFHLCFRDYPRDFTVRKTPSHRLITR
jgi:hypothetical protein